jgi:FKBP-type peptidyl-prolyl cis-trans isomerase (trigger factor)
MRMEEYLTHIKKTESELLADWAPAAEKRAKLQLVLNEIAKRENITPDEGLLESQTTELLARYKDADPMRVRVYVASILQNEAVMQLLETTA